MSVEEASSETSMNTEVSTDQSGGAQNAAVTQEVLKAATAVVWDASAIESATPVAISVPATVLASSAEISTTLASASSIISPIASTPTTVVEIVANRSPAPTQAVNPAPEKRMLYKVKFQAHLEDGRLILLEDTIFEAMQMETTDMFLDAVSTLDVCKRILNTLTIPSFHSELVKVKVAFNEPGHGFKGRKQYLYQTTDWKAMYSLFNSLRKKTTIYMTFDVRRKLKDTRSSSGAVLAVAHPKPIVVREKLSSSPATTASSTAAEAAVQQGDILLQQSATPNGMVYSNGEPLSKRLFQVYDPPRLVGNQVPSIVDPAALQQQQQQTAAAVAAAAAAYACPNCSNTTFKRLEVRCALREKLLAQLKTVADLSGGKVSEVDEEVLRKVQQDTLEDITLLCSQT